MLSLFVQLCFVLFTTEDVSLSLYQLRVQRQKVCLVEKLSLNGLYLVSSIPYMFCSHPQDLLQSLPLII